MKKLFSDIAHYPERDTWRPRRRSILLICLICGAALFSITLSAGTAFAHEADPHPHAEDSEVGDTKHKPPEHGSLGEIGHKLANSLADLWSLSMNFETPKFFDGDVNTGDPKRGADMIFQPVMPLPLYGEGDATWRLITRPIIPLIFRQPIPTGFNDFDHKSVMLTSRTEIN